MKIFIITAMMVLFPPMFAGDTPVVLPLKRPPIEWIRCTCPNGTELGLTTTHFIWQTAYVASLEYIRDQCQNNETVNP